VSRPHAHLTAEVPYPFREGPRPRVAGGLVDLRCAGSGLHGRRPCPPTSPRCSRSWRGCCRGTPTWRSVPDSHGVPTRNAGSRPSAAMSRELLPLVQDAGWLFDTELLVLTERAGLRIGEVPVDWADDPDSRVDVVATARAACGEPPAHLRPVRPGRPRAVPGSRVARLRTRDGDLKRPGRSARFQPSTPDWGHHDRNQVLAAAV